jgi:hypothetical protein
MACCRDMSFGLAWGYHATGQAPSLKATGDVTHSQYSHLLQRLGR